MLKRFLRAANATIFGQIIARFGSFILIPIFLAHWSPAVYGEWLTLYAAVGYLSSLDVGMQAAALNRLTAAYARKDLADYRRAQNSALAMYVVIAAVGMTVLLIAACTMPVGRWLGLRITSRTDASIVLLLLGMYILWSMPSKIVTGSYQTMGNLARSQWVSNGQAILSMILMAVLLLLNQGMKSIAILPLAVSVIAGAVVVFDLRRHLPDLVPGISAANWSTVCSLVKPTIGFGILTAGMLLHYQALTLLVSIGLGGAAVAVFSVSRTLVVLLRTASDTIADSIAPDVCRLDAVQDKGRLGQLLGLVVGLSACIGIAGAAAIWWEGGSVITLWTRGRLIPDPLLLRVFAATAIGQSAWVCLCVFGTATNRNRTVAVSILVSNVIAIGVAISLLRRLGIIAVPIGLLIGEALACYHFVVRDACRRCAVPYRAFATKLWSFVAVTSVLAIAAAYPVHATFGGRLTVLRWLSVGITTLLITSASTWFCWFDQDRRNLLKTRIGALRRKADLSGLNSPEAIESAIAGGVTYRDETLIRDLRSATPESGEPGSYRNTRERNAGSQPLQ